MNMKPALDFCKAYSVTLASSAVAVGAIAAGVLGMMSDAVETKMKSQITASGAMGIGGMISNAKNQTVIDAEKKRGEAFEADYLATIEEAKKINRREPLIGEVFPKPAKDSTPFTFRDAYFAELHRMPIYLAAGAPPNESDIEEERQNVADQLLIEKEQKAESDASGSRTPEAGGGAPPAPTPPQFREDPPPFGGAPRGGRSVGGVSSAGSRGLDMNVPAEPKYDAVLRARVNRARSLLCYYTPELTFHSALPRDDASAPSPADMWYAQMTLWIQKDVAQAIASLNREFADKVTGHEPYVEDVPVKRLTAIRVLGYETEKGRVTFPSLSDAGALTERAAIPSFTARVSNDKFDVVRFEVGVIVDQREMLRLIDRIGRANFYKCVGVAYDAVDRAKDESEGYLYGTAPVVFARLSFEGYFARDVFNELKPETVRVALGEQPATPAP